MRPIFKFSLLLVASSILTGCVAIEGQPFVPKSLDKKAKGIATIKTSPYGCKLLGEVEGYEAPARNRMNNGVITEITDITSDAVREGALNDARNKAAEIVGNSKKRTVLYLSKETPTCLGGCSKNPEIFDIQWRNNDIRGYRVSAQVFECDK